MALLVGSVNCELRPPRVAPLRRRRHRHLPTAVISVRESGLGWAARAPAAADCRRSPTAGEISFFHHKAKKKYRAYNIIIIIRMPTSTYYYYYIVRSMDNVPAYLVIRRRRHTTWHTRIILYAKCTSTTCALCTKMHYAAHACNNFLFDSDAVCVPASVGSNIFFQQNKSIFHSFLQHDLKAFELV